jgi:hypothetical protein
MEIAMLEAVISFLIYICIVAIVVYVVIWVLRDVIGVPIPAKVVQLLWVIVALIAILFLVRLILPYAGGRKLFGMLDALPFIG